METAGELRFGRATLQPARRQLMVDGQPVAVGSRALDLLLALIERRDRVVAKAELLDLVWQGLVVEENNLQVQISTLRKLLGSQAIATIPGRGYRFTLTVQVADDGAQQVSVAPTAARSAASDLGPGNLPEYLAPLFGRDQDVLAVKDLLSSHPLVTLLGAGGIGKTRLAEAVAHAQRAVFADGAWVVELAPVSNPSQALRTLAQTLNISLGGAIDTQQAIVDALRRRRMLIVLDNCEHVIEPVARLAEALLTGAPDVRLLATSQVPLRLPQEQRLRLGTLAVPEAADTPQASRYGAVALFVARAHAADPQFSLDADNVAAVTEICRRLDGIPLAIELAAARVTLLGVNGLRERLGERLQMLSGGARFALPRHQTLLAALDWSHGLLSPSEQIVFRRLGVFAGGFTLEAAQQVAGEEGGVAWQVLDELGALVEKSLVVAEGREPPRYRMLESIRAHAARQRELAGETRAIARRHALAVCRLFVQADEQRFGDQGMLSGDAFVQLLEPEIENLRTALQWADGPSGDPGIALALAASAAEAFNVFGLLAEGLSIMRLRLAQADAAAGTEVASRFWSGLLTLGRRGRVERELWWRAMREAERELVRPGLSRRLHRVLVWKAWALGFQREASAAEILRQAEALEHPGWPTWPRSLRLNAQAIGYMNDGDYARALGCVQEAEAILPAKGEQRERFYRRVTVCFVTLCLRQKEKALPLARDLVAQARSIRFDPVAIEFALAHLVHTLTFLDRLDEAQKVTSDAAVHWRRHGLGNAMAGALALLAAKQGRYLDAARLAGAQLAYKVRGGPSALGPVEEWVRAEALALIKAAGIHPTEIERCLREGAELDADAALELMLPRGANRAGDSEAVSLQVSSLSSGGRH